METKFYRIVDREPESDRVFNGGDYCEGRTVAVQDGKPVALRYWTSFDGGFCNRCGRYEPFSCDCNYVARPRDCERWETGELLTGIDEEFAVKNLAKGDFVEVR